MTALLELRDKLQSFYVKNEVLILPVIKFLLAFLTLLVINGEMGYMARANNIAVVLIASLMCSFLPTGFIIVVTALFTMLHMYALSFEIAIFGLIVYMLMFLLFFRFSPKDSLVVVLMPLLCSWKVPYAIPIAMGLLGTPASAVSVACGTIVYYMLLAVTSNASAIKTINAGDATAKLRLVVDALIGNKAMLVMVVAFAVTVVVVYLVRRMSIDYSWTIAMVAGAILNLMILLVGDLLYETNISVIGAILGNILALLIAKVIEFFRFCVDHSRTERVQFEDDEYYYYVKAVPKMTVSAPTKTVKHINTPRKVPESMGRASGAGSDRTSGTSTGRASGSGTSTGRASGSGTSTGRVSGSGTGTGRASGTGTGRVSGSGTSTGRASGSGTSTGRVSGTGTGTGRASGTGTGRPSGTGRAGAGDISDNGRAAAQGRGIRRTPDRSERTTGGRRGTAVSRRQDDEDDYEELF